MRLLFLRQQEVLNIHAHVIEAFGGSPGLRDEGALASAAEIFLEINGAHLNATNDQIVALFLGIASGRLSRDEVVELFNQWVIF